MGQRLLVDLGNGDIILNVLAGEEIARFRGDADGLKAFVHFLKDYGDADLYFSSSLQEPEVEGVEVNVLEAMPRRS